MHLKSASTENMVQFLRGIFSVTFPTEMEMVFSGKKIKNWGHLLNTEAGSFVLLVSHWNPLPGRVQAHECQKCTAKMGQGDLTWTRGRGKWAQNSYWHISINKELNPDPSPRCSRGFFRILTLFFFFLSSNLGCREVEMMMALSQAECSRDTSLPPACPAALLFPKNLWWPAPGWITPPILT